MKHPTSLDGHVPANSPMSTRRAFSNIPALPRKLVQYELRELWERDTASLPAVLRDARRAVRAFAERELVPVAERTDKLPHTELANEPELLDLVMRAGRAGLLTDMLPRPLGSGPVRSFRYPLVWYQAIRTEELARVCGGLMLLLSAHSLGVAPLVFSGDLRTLRRVVIPAFRALRRGEPELFAYAITEPAAGSDVEDGHGAQSYRPGTVAHRVPGGWSLVGRKCFISGGDLARYITLFASLHGEGMESWTCFLVRSDAPGYRVVRTERKMGMRASAAAELEFDDVFVPDHEVVGGLRNGWALNRATLNASRIPVAGMAVGLAQGATEAAVDFACRTRLANKPLINFQEIQLAIAQMIADTEMIRALVWHAGRSEYAPRQDLAAMCKFQCTDVAVRVAEAAMELMSNHGMLHANRAEKIFRDARLTQIFEGTNQINRLAVIEDQQEHLLARIARSIPPGARR